MSIKRETDNFNWKAFGALFLLIAFLTGSIHSTLAYFATSETSVYQYLYWYGLYPILFASILANNFRKGSLTITQFQTIENFQSKLTKRLLEFSDVQSASETQSIFVPRTRFKKLFNN